MSEDFPTGRFGYLVHTSGPKLQALQARAHEAEDLKLLLMSIILWLPKLFSARNRLQVSPYLKDLIAPFVCPALAGDREVLGKALICAATWGMDGVVLRLLKRGADISFAYPDDDSALIFALYEGCVEILDILLKHGADVNIGYKNGRTPLWQAAAFRDVNLSKSDSERRSAAMVQLLLDAGAFVNTADRDGVTPIMKAAENGYVSVVRLLLSQGADKWAKDSRGKEASDYARGKRVKKLLA